MKNSIYSILAVVILTGFLTQLRAQEVVIPDPNLNAAIHEALGKPAGPLTQQDMLGLTGLSAIFRNITNMQGLEAALNLVSLDLQDNRITNVNVLTNLTKLTVLDLSENRFPELGIPGGLTNLTTLRLENGRLTSLTFPAGLTKLTSLRVGFNQLSDLALPADMTNLTELSAYQNQLTNLTLPSSLANLNTLNLDGNLLSRVQLPPGLTKLVFIALGGNRLTSFTVPADMTNLMALRINDNQLTDLALPAGLNQLSLLVASRNQLSRLTFPAGLTSLAILELISNQLTNITFPPDLQQLTGLFVADNPLMAFVLSEPLAATGMASVVDSFQTQGIPVFTYPLAIRLTFPKQQPIGAFRFGITGPPGVYTVYASSNLPAWGAVSFVNNPLGGIFFMDTEAHLTPQKFFRAVWQTPPTNMVFIPANTFVMGSPTNDLDASVNERPPTTVTLTHGYWIGKFEVTQGEYLSVTGTNPSEFPGDLQRPVSSMSWSDATNYCRLLTQQELASGRIPPGSHYRLPTEAEWECAARAGTMTRFSYGDDPTYGSLTNYAWFLEDLAHPDLIVHAVGQKLPNPWGLYDMYGNVWEWCQDWYGALPGGAVTNPTGPTSSPLDSKVMRGGAYDYPNSSCRSASRLFQFHNDTDLGFRVVLAFEP